MKIGDFDTNEKVLIIAEIGNNHEGSEEAAARMVDAAAAAGVDAVKFQTYRTRHYVSPLDEARFARLEGFRLTDEQFARLADRASSHGLMFISTPFDIESAHALEPLVPAYKISSGDNTFLPLLDTVARTGKPVIVSTGLADLTTVRYAKALFERHWRLAGIGEDLFSCLHCVSAYPTPPDEANLAAIGTLHRALDCTVGYSDHTLGIDAAVLSVAAGARIVEKHFTLDKNFSQFRDHQLSADPDEMASLVQRIREAEILLGSGEKRPSASESETGPAIRRSIAAARDLPGGTTLGWSDITWIRPGSGLAPGRETEILGRRLREPVSGGTLITADLLE